jgi:hypothetical protein
MATMETKLLANPTDPTAWQSALYAFLAEKERRSGSRLTVEGYSRMLAHFFGRVGKTPATCRERPSRDDTSGRSVSVAVPMSGGAFSATRASALPASYGTVAPWASPRRSQTLSWRIPGLS